MEQITRLQKYSTIVLPPWAAACSNVGSTNRCAITPLSISV
ncbi:Uncharacterised protein [Vibrio cholerae]|nr:Uncharacterised protein [Vibrio cholerae]